MKTLAVKIVFLICDDAGNKNKSILKTNEKQVTLYAPLCSIVYKKGKDSI